MSDISILISCEDDLEVSDALKEVINDTVLFWADYMSISGNVEVSVFITDSDRIKILNKKYRKIDKATNVLSFPCDINCGIIGDIVLAIDVVRSEAMAQNKAFYDHLKHLIVHSLLHLVGYDHIDDNEANIMESLEIKILEKMGIRNPYLEME